VAWPCVRSGVIPLTQFGHWSDWQNPFSTSGIWEKIRHTICNQIELGI